MASAEQQQQLMNEEDEDPYKSTGHIELRIENFAGFVQEEAYSQRLSEPAYVRGMLWEISATIQNNIIWQTEQTIDCWLYCHQIEAFHRGYSVNAQMKVLAQKEGSVDLVVDEVKEKRFRGWGYDLKFEDLINPDNGWYDKQTDSIVLAVDLTANEDDECDEYVVVAENELKLNKVPASFSMQIGNLGWQIDFGVDKKNKGQKLLVLRCEDVAAGRADKVLLELFGYHRQDGPKSVAYSPFPKEKPYSIWPVHRHLFTRKNLNTRYYNSNSMTVNIPGASDNNILFTVRVLKQRSQFPDFTNTTTRVGRFSANVKLRVGDQQFHVNKQFLAMLSGFFDRMFNGDNPAATTQMELSLKMHSPELFQHFLLVMCVNEVLPNSINVAALFKLADFYDAENLREKCDQHLRMAREMPLEKRVQLARDHGSKETRDLLAIESVNV